MIIKLSQMYSQSTVSSPALSKFPKVLEQRGQDGNNMGKFESFSIYNTLLISLKFLCETQHKPAKQKKATPAGPGFHLGALASQVWQISVLPNVSIL